MSVTEDQLRKVQEIYLEQARDHFPPSVQFKEANASVITDKCGDEWIRIEFLYSAPEPVLDAKLMNSLHRRTDEPMLAAGITGLTMVGYVNTSDPTRLGFDRPPEASNDDEKYQPGGDDSGLPPARYAARRPRRSNRRQLGGRRSQGPGA